MTLSTTMSRRAGLPLVWVLVFILVFVLVWSLCIGTATAWAQTAPNAAAGTAADGAADAAADGTANAGPATPLAQADPDSRQRRGSERRAEAERFFRAAEQAYNSGQYSVAAELFEEAYGLLPLPAIAFSMAQAYRLQYFIDRKPGNLVRAIDLYRTYIGEVDKGGRRDDATANLSQLEPIRLRLEAAGQLGDIRRRLQRRTQLMVTAQVEGAYATVGDVSGEVPLVVEVEPGNHQVEVTAEGYFPAAETAVAVKGQFIAIEVEMQAKPSELTVRSEGGARIAVNGRPLGRTPLAQPLELSAGKHFVTVSKRGRNPWSTEITSDNGEVLVLEAKLAVTTRRRASYWVLAGAGVTLSAAAAFGALAWDTDRDMAPYEERLRDESLYADEYQRYQRLRDRRDTRLRLGYGLAGGSAAIALIGGLLYWFDNPPVSGQNRASVSGNADAASSVSEQVPRARSSSPYGATRITPVIDRQVTGFAVTACF